LRRPISTGNYCTSCQQVKNERAHHCSICGFCTRRFDHHCPWTGNCVGWNNHLEFYGYLIGHLVCNTALAYTSYCVLADHFTQQDLSLWNFLWELQGYRSAMLLFCVIVPIAAFFMVGALFWFQTRCILLNTTTKEYGHGGSRSKFFRSWSHSLVAFTTRWRGERYAAKL
jgi:hypothetical protein